jgi:hypothetical protein
VRFVRCDISREMPDTPCEHRTFIYESGLHDIVICMFANLPYCEFYFEDLDMSNPHKGKNILYPHHHNLKE